MVPPAASRDGCVKSSTTTEIQGWTPIVRRRLRWRRANEGRYFGFYEEVLWRGTLTNIMVPVGPVLRSSFKKNHSVQCSRCEQQFDDSSALFGHFLAVHIEGQADAVVGLAAAAGAKV